MFHDFTSLGDFIRQVREAADSFGGLTAVGKLSVIITLLVSSLKVAPVTRYLWSRLGWAQVLVAPALALAAGLVALSAAGAPVTLPVLLAYLTAGAGSVFLHELLDALKGAPGLGPVFVKVLDFVESFLAPVPPGGSPTLAPAAPVDPTPSHGPLTTAQASQQATRAILDDRRIGKFL